MHAKIPDLLEHVQTLLTYEAKLAQVQGDQFNIFHILGIQSREVTTHSPYLAEFLNPSGKHGLGDRPLATFIKLFQLKLDPATTRVQEEHWLGPVTTNSGGRVDILLTDTSSGNQVAIENKVYAADQPDQLARYMKELPKAQIIYLTLDGRSPDDFTTTENEHVLCISYTKDIIGWQEICRREAVSAPVVRETITQYINLLKNLTGQSTNPRMSDQIVQSVLKNQASFTAYRELVKTEAAVQMAILARLRAQCNEIADSLGLTIDFPLDGLERRYNGFSFRDHRMPKEVSIRFEFQTGNYRSLIFGFKCEPSFGQNIARTELLANFKQVFDTASSSQWWPAFTEWRGPDGGDWSDETFADIAFRISFKTELREKIEKLATMVRSLRSSW